MATLGNITTKATVDKYSKSLATAMLYQLYAYPPYTGFTQVSVSTRSERNIETIIWPILIPPKLPLKWQKSIGNPACSKNNA